MAEGRSNRLARETSPYLLQHAHNPVDWYPWSEEAIETARRLNKPIFLSVGYSACHWCHVMEHESFEDPETARIMNESFVSIKVDREERPDVDEIYMQSVQLFTGGHGGWPMSVFLTPDLEPYFAGTYFPPADRPGLPGLRKVLQLTADAYHNKRDDIANTTQQVVAALREMAAVKADEAVPGPETLDSSFTVLEKGYDAREGGFGSAPKFPRSMDLSFLFRYGLRTGRPEATRMALHTLRKMARGGMYDQLGGGFHRYSTDARWCIPHFEKMLYDNALLARTYLEAFLVTRDEFFRDITTEILDYVAREMTNPEGGFYSAQDADSEGFEGKFFVWTPAEIRDLLGAEAGRAVCNYYGVTENGNFEHGTSSLCVPRDPDVVAVDLGMGLDELLDVVARGRRALFEARQKRVHPGRDDKVIATWNGLMISAYAQAYEVLRRPQDLERAEAAARFVLERSRDGLFRTWKDGCGKGRGYLDDHACMIAALLDLYEARFEPHWIETALGMNDVVLREFWDDGEGGFFYTGSRHETLIARSRNFLDTATPSGNSVQTSNLIRLWMLTGDDSLRERAARTLRAFGKALRQYPTAMAEMLNSLDLFHGPAAEVAVVGGGHAAEELVREVFGGFMPRKVVAGWPPSGEPADLALLRGRAPVDGRPAAYVCRHHACLAPITSASEVRRALLRVAGSGAGRS
ncbi:MAG: thioredoxin domain-containing protein [Candidatus Krumholzibacteriia bacterium]